MACIAQRPHQRDLQAAQPGMPALPAGGRGGARSVPQRGPQCAGLCSILLTSRRGFLQWELCYVSCNPARPKKAALNGRGARVQQGAGAHSCAWSTCLAQGVPTMTLQRARRVLANRSGKSAPNKDYSLVLSTLHCNASVLMALVVCSKKNTYKVANPRRLHAITQ